MSDTSVHMRNKSSGGVRLTALLLVIVMLAIVAFVIDRFTTSRDAPGAFVEYDAAHHVVQRIASDGRIARYLYDDHRQLVGISYHRLGRLSGHAYDIGEAIRFAYDAAGRRTQVEDSTGITRYACDELARPASVATPDGKKVSYSYDPWGRVHEMTYPDGTRVRYEHDYYGQLVSVSEGDRETRYEYNATAVVRRLPNGVTTTYGRTASGALGSITHRRGDGSLIAELRYQHDAVGRITTIDERTESGGARTRYDYDKLGRVVRVVGPEGATTFAYDPMGNRISESGPEGSRRFEYDAEGRLVRAGDARFVYDSTGSLIERSDGKRSAEYEYDAEGRLIEVRTGGKTIRYVYDGEGQRVARDIDGHVTRSMHHRFAPAAQVVAEEGEGIARRYLLGSSRLAQVDRGGQPLYFLEDHLGSTRWIVDGQARVAARYAYTPFGSPRLLSGDARTRFLFAGEEWDEDAGLLYLRARDYDPDLGRFLSADPVEGRPWDPQTYNLYAYAANDPVNRIDPLGLQSWFPPPPPPPPSYYDPTRSWMSGTWWRMGNPWMPPPPPPSYLWTLTRNVWDSVASGSFFEQMTPRQQEMEFFLHYLGWTTDVGFGSDVMTINEALRNFNQGNWITGSANIASMFIHGVPWFTAADVVLSIPNENLIQGANLIASWPHRSTDPLDFMGGLEPSAFLFDQTRNLIYDDARAASKNILYDLRSRDILDYTARFDPFIAGTLDDTRNIFFPPPGGGGGDLPLVGGVYLDQAAKVIGELGTITGAVYDAASGRCILVGDRRTSLPPMRPDYLAAALRAVHTESPHEPGMTIDPLPENPHAPIMLVIFLGNTENTRLGWVMFEADRVMKGYSIGRDNITRDPVRSRIPGYQSVTAMALADPGAETGLWSRFWLVPEPITARVSDDGRSVQLDPIRMRVKTETMRWAGGRLVPAGDVRDAHAEAFAEHFTKNYDAYAAEQPIYAELRQVAAAVALAKWMKERGVPIDWNVNRLLEGPPHPTPSTTPAAFAEEEKTWMDGDSIRTLRMYSFGGVEMTPQLVPRRSDDAISFRNAVSDAWKRSRRSGKDAFTVNAGGREYRAFAFPDAHQKEVASYSTTVTDLPRATTRLRGLSGLTRSYDSLHNEATEFGRSWSLLLPRLDFLDAGSNGSEYLSVKGQPNTQVLVQRFVLSNAFGRSQVSFDESFVDPELQRIGFKPKASSLVRGVYPEEGGLYRLFFANNDQALFDARGRLVAMLTPSTKALYDYDQAGRLAAIRWSDAGAQEDVRFTHDAQGRIASVTAGDEQVSYSYDGTDNLVHARSSASDVAYRYDARHLLQTVTLGGGTALTNRYDDAGRLIEQHAGGDATLKQRTEILADGSRVVHIEERGREGKRQYDAAMRLIKEETPAGIVRSYSYRDHRLAAVDLSAANGVKARIDYDAGGNVRSFRDARGVQVELKYHANGLPAQTVINGRPYASYGYDAAGRVREVAYAGGWGETYEWDAAGKLAVIHRTTPTRAYTIDLTAAMPPPLLASPRAIVDDRTRTIRRRNAMGTETVLQYAASGSLATVLDPAGGRTSFDYETHRRLHRITLPDGTCREYRYDSAGRVVRRGRCGEG